MKQSTKLLSLVLALVMAFSCMAVIGNAALVKSEVTWDNIDDAQLTAEQVADLALDMVDNDLLAGMETIDLSILGSLRLNKIDYIIEDICTLRDSFAWTIGSGLLGDLGDMDFAPLLQSGSFGLFSSHTAYQRSHGDINVIMALLEFIGNDNNSNILSKAAYGLNGGNGVSLGLIGSFLNLGEIGDMLSNIPLMLTEMVYDMLLHGSYGYDDSVDDLKEAGQSLPTTADTLNEIINRAIGGLLTYPQDYSWEGEGDAAVKVWNEKSLLMPTVAKYGIDTVMDYFSVTGSSTDYDGDGEADKNSLFQLIDKLAPFAIYDLGVGALNNNLKKTLMEAVEVDFNEIDVATLPASVAEDFEVDGVPGEESYVTYIAYDKIAEFGGNWYYTTLENETIVDAATGEPVLDEDGNEQSEKVRKYFRANTASANKFFSLIDFGWEFVAPEPLTDEANSEEFGLENLSSLNYAALITEYGSIMESLNHLLYVVFETAVKQEVKDEFADMTGDYWVDGPTTECIMDNAERLLKYLLAEHADSIFGQSSPYVAWEYADVEDKTLVDIIAIIGPVFFEDAMPQLIMPKNEDGTYAFHEGVQVLEFGALVIREFMTEIAPNVNYDSYIFEEGNVKSANDRQFKVQDAETWYNIILNIGMDIAYTYLNNITNFNTALPTQAITEARWKDMLGAAVTWAANYVSDGTNSIIHGFEPAKLEAYTDPFDKLSYVLNTLLPLGFICGCTSSEWDFDTELLFNKVKAFLTSFDLTEVATLFGRNEASAYNAFDDENLITVVLTLVNDIVNLVLPISENGDGYTDLLQGETSRNLDTVVSQANLKITVQQLLRALYTQGRELLNCALPVLGMFVKGWGTEQQFNTPQISLSRTIDLTNGATAAAVEVQVRNASNGVWRHYKDASGTEHTDNQYQIQLISVNAYDQFGNTASAYVTPTLVTTTNIDYGQYGTFTYTAANVPTSGAIVRFEVGYKVYNEDGEAMANGKVFYAKSFAWLNYNPTNEGTAINAESESYRTSMYTPQYIGLDNAMTEIPEIRTAQFWRENVYFGSAQTNSITPSTATVDGITFGAVSIKPNNANYTSLDLYNFKTYSDTWYDEDGGNGKAFSVAGSVNEATWTAANKQPGSTSTWSVTLVTKNQTLSNQEFKIVYYDDVYQNKLAQLAADEMGKVRAVEDYNLSGKVYANGILTSANSEDEDGETIFRETNYTDTAWIAAADGGKWAGSYTDANGDTITETVTTYAESAVADIATETDADGNVISATGVVEVDGEKISVKKVTVIDCATAVNNYATAFVSGVQGGMQAFNDNMVFDVATRYEALYVTSNDIDYCKKSTEQVINEGNSENIDGAVSALKTSVDTIEATYSDTKDYTDYKMYRWNRYNDARDDAKYFINLQNDAKNATVAEIDESFPYTWIEEDDLRALVSGDKNETYITALLEKLDEEEIKSKEEWLEAKKIEYASQTLLDVEMAANLVERVAPRLLARDHGVITTYLADEITSADNMVGAESQYTARSWAKYIDAYNAAKTVLSNPTQMTVFDAKYELMVARNELVKVEDEADYSELEALIAQAQMVMKNTGLYDNTAKELGQVLAELGYDAIENADGDLVQLFPGSALLVNEEPYSIDDQDKIDDAATALKEALARLKFKGLNITGTNVATETVVPGNEAEGIEDITASVARIAPELDADAVKALLGATATSANVTTDLITVSNDVTYTIDTDLEYYTGTNATVTFYTLVSGVKVPVATVKIVVEADVNGDGVLDVLDGSLTELTANEHAQLEGCYFIAANLDTATEEIAGADYTAVINKILLN